MIDPATDTLDDEAGDPGQRLVRQIGVKPLRRINRLLLEGLFFYRKDDPVHFDMLRNRPGPFRELWDHYFGLDLEIADNVAYRRLATMSDDPKAGFLNDNIPLAGRALFTWTDRGARELSITFLLFLRFYEQDLRHRQDAGHGERRFFYHEFYRVAQQAFDEWFPNLPDQKPTDQAIFNACKEVFETMERFRFIERENEDDIAAGDSNADLGRGYAFRKVIMYRALEGLRAYNPNTLTTSLIETAYRTATPSSPGGTA